MLSSMTRADCMERQGDLSRHTLLEAMAVDQARSSGPGTFKLTLLVHACTPCIAFHANWSSLEVSESHNGSQMIN